MFYAKLIVTSAVIASMLVPGMATAAEGAAEKAIRERIASLETAWAKGDAKYIATQVYGSDALIHGEGQKEFVRTPEGVNAIIEHLVAGSKSIKVDIHSIKTLGNNAATSWVTWHVTPKAATEKPFDVRALFVWTKGKEGWRIRDDMYSFGRM
jgi:uncharacterized protein (TIGR02246 family)